MSSRVTKNALDMVVIDIMWIIRHYDKMRGAVFEDRCSEIILPLNYSVKVKSRAGRVRRRAERFYGAPGLPRAS